MKKIKTDYCSDYTEYKLYADTFEVGATCYVDSEDGAYKGKIKSSIEYIDDEIDDVEEDIDNMCGEYDFTGEFITDNCCYYIGVDIVGDAIPDAQFEYDNYC